MLIDEKRLYDGVVELYKENTAKLEVFKMKMGIMRKGKEYSSLDERMKMLSKCGVLEGYNKALGDVIKLVMKVRKK